jgi:hypothetical protein
MQQDKDIRKYLQDCVDKRQVFHPYSEEILEKVTRRAAGMFRYAVLSIGVLISSPITPAEFESPSADITLAFSGGPKRAEDFLLHLEAEFGRQHRRADIEKRDSGGTTPFRHEEEYIREGVLRLFLDHGADSKYRKSHTFDSLKAFLKIEKPDLVNFYPQDDRKLEVAAAKAALMVESLSKLGCSNEMAVRFSTLTLYDMVILVGE